MIHARPRLALCLAALACASLQGCGGRSVDLDRSTPSDAGMTSMPSSDTIVLPEEMWTLAIDDTRVYWTTSSSKLQSCLKEDCEHTVITYAEQAGNPAVAGGHVYWKPFEQPGVIASCPSAGCSGTPVRVVQDPSLAAISADGDYVYWVSALDIYRCLYTGCGQVPELVAARETPLWPLVFSATDAYWITRETPRGDPTVIRHAPKDGSALPTTLTTAMSITLAIAGSSMYWLDYGSGALSTCPLAGCDPTPATLATDIGSSVGLVVEGSTAYWVPNTQKDEERFVRSCPTAGCGENALTLTLTGVVSFAVDDQFLYWTEADPHHLASGKNIHRTPK
jgi:hypothetical protein